MENINFLLVLIEGVLAFLSPCVLPLLPVYIGILANSSNLELESGQVRIFNSSLFKNTVLFILGIATTFFILGTSITALNKFITQNKEVIMIIGGIIIIFMGLFYSGWLNIPFLQRERKFHHKFDEIKPSTAYILGFTFSFGWTPCIGPMLASVLIMASSANSRLIGNLMILVYTIGFIVPFLIIAIFYKYLFKHLKVLNKYLLTIQKIGGIIIIISGILMFFGGIKDVNNIQLNNNVKQGTEEQGTSDTEENDENEAIMAPDFTLVDQYGNTQKLSNYKGKVVFLNFWATWCPPCRGEMPHIEEIYNEYNKNSEEVVILGVASPDVGKEGPKEDIIKFLEENNYSFPVAFDEGGDVAGEYYISALPTTFIINKDGTVKGYVPGAMDKETMIRIIEDSLK